MIRPLLFLLGAFSLAVASHGQSVTDADKLMGDGEFTKALVTLGELNRKKAGLKFASSLGKDPRQFSVLAPSGSPLVIRTRALFERGFHDYLDEAYPTALVRWSDCLQLLSQAEDASTGFELRRISTALFVTGLNGAHPSVETFNRSLKATSEQIDQLPLPKQADIFTQQLQTEFEIYAAHQVLASVFSAHDPEANTLDLWENLLARRKLTQLVCQPTEDISRRQAYESIFDLVFFSDTNRQRLHESIFKNSLVTLALADPERYSAGLARLAMLQALLFNDNATGFALDERTQTMAELRWPRFSTELVSILERCKASRNDDLQTRLLKPVIPVLNRLVLSATDTLVLASALIECGEAKAAHDYCVSAIERFPEERLRNRFQALISVALVKQQRFPEALAAASKVTELQALSLDEFAALTYYRGVTYAQLGNYQASINEYRALLKVAPHQKFAADAQLGIVLQFLNIGDREKARGAFRDYQARYPNTVSADFARKLLSGL